MLGHEELVQTMTAGLDNNLHDKPMTASTGQAPKVGNVQGSSLAQHCQGMHVPSAARHEAPEYSICTARHEVAYGPLEAFEDDSLTGCVNGVKTALC